MIEEYDAIKPLFDAASYTPVGFGKPINDRLAEHPDGRKWLRRQARSAWEIIRDNFEDDHCRCFMLWMAFQTVTPPEWPMTGRLAYSLVWGRQRWSWCIPKGGSGVLTEILVRLIEDHGGVALTDKMVERLIVENGRCVGVECADGSALPRRQGRALDHPHQAPDRHGAAQCWAEDFVDGVETWQGGPTLFVSHYATSEPMTFQGDGGAITPIACAMLSEPTRALRMGYDFARGAVNVEEPVLLAVSPTIGDPTQAPPGHHTIKIIGMQPYDLKEGPAALGQHQGRGRRSQSELAAALFAQPHRRQDPRPRGRKPARSGAAQPAQLARQLSRRRAERGAGRRAAAGAGWAQHRMPIPGLYQTGSTTHPGGSISGGPGRNAAAVMLKDFGGSLEDVVARNKAGAKAKAAAFAK